MFRIPEKRSGSVGRSACRPKSIPFQGERPALLPARNEHQPPAHGIVERRSLSRSKYDRYVYGGGRPHLSFDHLRMTAVLLPPLAEQHEIVRRVDALFALADKIEARLAAATSRVEKITQAILAKAFRGELVPTEAELARAEGRDDEPASVLLERIRAAREATAFAPPKGPRRRRTQHT